MRIGVISGYYPGRRFNSHVNHSAYCRQHGYYYVDASYPGRHPRPHFRKLEVIDEHLDLFDWVFWIDDDAYFTDFNRRLEPFLESAGTSHLVICRSPSTKTIFTKFSAGQFFLRNSQESRALLHAALRVDLDFVRNRFWHDGLGHLDVGDQSALVYLTEADPRFTGEFTQLLDHNQFNNRDFEFVARADEHFLVHFIGDPKEKVKKRFCQRLGLNKYIIPDPILRTLNVARKDDGA